jgi:hypothetical protein
MVSSLLPPLSTQVEIVDKDGKPTPQFARILQKLALGSGLDVSNGVIDFATIAAKTILANKTAGTAAPTACSIDDILDFIAGTPTQGDILFRGASGWKRLPAGTAGKVLQTNGASADPTWVTPSSGGSGGASYAGFLTSSPPDPATFTLVGSNPGGTTTSYLAGSYFNITLPASGTSAKYTKNLPTAPYTIYCAVSISGDSTIGNDLSVNLYDASNNIVRKIRQTMVSADYRWGVSSGAGDIKTLSGAQRFGTNATLFMRMKNDSTNITYSFSMDNGLTWLVFYSEAISGISAATKWGFQTANASSTLTFGATFWALYTA